MVSKESFSNVKNHPFQGRKIFGYSFFYGMPCCLLILDQVHVTGFIWLFVNKTIGPKFSGADKNTIGKRTVYIYLSNTKSIGCITIPSTEHPAPIQIIFIYIKTLWVVFLSVTTKTRRKKGELEISTATRTWYGTMKNANNAPKKETQYTKTEENRHIKPYIWTKKKSRHQTEKEWNQIVL